VIQDHNFGCCARAIPGATSGFWSVMNQIEFGRRQHDLCEPAKCNAIDDHMTGSSPTPTVEYRFGGNCMAVKAIFYIAF